MQMISTDHSGPLTHSVRPPSHQWQQADCGSRQFDELAQTLYREFMKVKTSITVEKDLLKVVDALSSKYKNRSEFIEVAIQSYIAQITRSEQNAKDLEIINHYADNLNQEALDVLDYQVTL